MAFLTIINFLSLVLPLLVPAINADISPPGASSTTDDERTMTVYKRAPSAYPYGDPYPGEWQYENWDPNDDGQRQRAERIHAAFGQWRDMVSAALTEASDSVRVPMAKSLLKYWALR